MNEIQQRKLEAIIEDGYQFDFGEYIGKGFSLMQKNMGNFIGFALVAGLIVMVANFIPVIGALANNFVLIPAFTAGFYLVAHKVNQDQATQFNDFFKGFDFLGQLALAVLLQSLIMLAAAIPMGIGLFASGMFSNLMDSSFDPSAAFPFWVLIFLIPVIYLAVGYGWTMLFIVFYKMEAWPAMEMSRKIITKQWFMIFLFGIVIGLLAGLGAIALIIGLLFTIPAMLCAQYAAFADVTRLMEETESDIVDHLVE